MGLSVEQLDTGSSGASLFYDFNTPQFTATPVTLIGTVAEGASANSVQGLYFFDINGTLPGIWLDGDYVFRLHNSNSSPANEVIACFIGTCTNGSFNGLTYTNIGGSVWNPLGSAFTTPNSMGVLLKGAASAGDPWSTFIPGSYAVGTAGNIVGTLTAKVLACAQTTQLPTNFQLMQVNPVDGGVTVHANLDKINYALTTSEHQLIPVDVWSPLATNFNTGGTMGAKLNSAASAGDPWSTALPGTYSAGQAGFILGTNLNATITSRATSAQIPANLSLLAVGAGGGVTLDPHGLDTIQIETGYNLRQTLTLMAAESCGLVTNADTNAANFFGIGQPTTGFPRMSEVTDSSGNRQTIVLNPPS